MLSGATIDKGITLYVDGLYGPASAVAITVASGGTIVDRGGFISGLKLKNGGAEIISSGGTVSGMTLPGGVSVTVSSGGIIGASTIRGGSVTILSGGIVDGPVTFGPHGHFSIDGQPVGLQISGFQAGDTLRLSAFRFRAGETVSLNENAAKTQAALKITDNGLTATVTLFGQYVAAGFHLAAGAGGSTAITYTTSGAALELVGAHGHS